MSGWELLEAGKTCFPIPRVSVVKCTVSGALVGKRLSIKIRWISPIIARLHRRGRRVMDLIDVWVKFWDSRSETAPDVLDSS